MWDEITNPFPNFNFVQNIRFGFSIVLKYYAERGGVKFQNDWATKKLVIDKQVFNKSAFHMNSGCISYMLQQLSGLIVLNL